MDFSARRDSENYLGSAETLAGEVLEAERCYNGKCKDCNCGQFIGEANGYCECGHHYDRHEY